MEEDTFYRIPSKKEAEKLENTKPGDTVTFGDPEAPHFEPRWLAPDETPFEARLFDCREYALHMISNTLDKKVLEKYIEMQSSDGRQYIQNNFQDGVRIKCNVDFPFPDVDLPEGILFRSEMMEEKWNIYKFENQMYFVRSWTGELRYVTDYEKTEEGFVIKEIAMDRETFDEDKISFYVNEVHFLLISHALGYLIPHPLPPDIEDSPDSILKFSFSEFGNRGYFGYFSVK
ncbi:MAG: hypothetical protein HPY60_00485 [Candidatus Methanofastidiosum sp.]|nr:hypothetical protein [Methanofastidiosum sp.]